MYTVKLSRSGCQTGTDDVGWVKLTDMPDPGITAAICSDAAVISESLLALPVAVTAAEGARKDLNIVLLIWG